MYRVCSGCGWNIHAKQVFALASQFSMVEWGEVYDRVQAVMDSVPGEFVDEDTICFVCKDMVFSARVYTPIYEEKGE